MAKFWRLAHSLEQLRSQINAAYPTRDKTSDGSIGDQSHASRTSDHNPNAAGVVTAIDIDEDLSPEIHSVESIVDAIRASKDPRVKYIIYEGRITKKGSNLQKWEPYHGVNAHRHHAHVSVSSEPRFYDDIALWVIGGAVAKPETPAPAPDPGNGESEPEKPALAPPETPAPTDKVTVTSTTEAQGETKTETKEIAMTQTSPTSKKLTWAFISGAFISLVKWLWSQGTETAMSAFQVAMKNLPAILLILGLGAIAIWIWNREQDRRAARLNKVIDTNADKTKHDVVIT